MHEIHTSGRKSFRGCRRRWAWIFRDSWYPVTTAKPLEFGVAYHIAMEAWYNPETWKQDRSVIQALAISRFYEKCEQQKQHYLLTSQEDYLESEVLEDYKERVELGVGMLKYYFELSSQIDTHFTPVKVEIAFRVPIRKPDGTVLRCSCVECRKEIDDMGMEAYRQLWKGLGEYPGGLPVYYAGRIDALVMDEYGRLWIVDWKTARQLSQSQEFLELDDQVGSYPWALRELGIEVEGFLYHEQKKAFPKPPAENSSRRLGRLFSVNKQQDTDWRTYSSHVAEHDPEAYSEGLYDEFLQYLLAEESSNTGARDEGKFFRRFQVHKTDYELDQIGKNIYTEASEMISESTPIYPSPGRFSCTNCAFRAPCLGMNKGEDYLYTLQSMFEKREHYWVREPSTETKGGE